jgi:hypothetical protein
VSAHPAGCRQLIGALLGDGAWTASSAFSKTRGRYVEPRNTAPGYLRKVGRPSTPQERSELRLFEIHGHFRRVRRRGAG